MIRSDTFDPGGITPAARTCYAAAPMKTARFSLPVVLALAVLGGLVAILVLALSLPLGGFGPDIAAAALGGLIIYCFGALTAIGRHRKRRLDARVPRAAVPAMIVASPRSAVRLVRPIRSEPERVAA